MQDLAYELPRTPLPRTLVNKGKKKGRGVARDNYHLYRVYDYEDSRNSERFYSETGEVEEMFELTPTQYRAVRSQQDQTG